jgi:hypothetical protein
VAERSITREDVQGRTRTDKLVLTNPQAALQVALSIRHPWYRCQAMSTVAKHWGTKKQKLDLIEKALAVAQEQQEINRIVTVSAWPLGVLVEVDSNRAREHVTRLVQLANREEHTLRRADALFAVASSIRSEAGLLAAVVPALTATLLGGHGWRIDRLIRSTLEIVKSMPEVADKLVEHHSDGKKKRDLLNGRIV